MLELLLVAFIQLNTAFGDASATSSIESGGNGWGDTHIEATADTTALDSGGNGWGDTH